MLVVFALAALAAVTAGHQPGPAEWMPDVVARRAAHPPPPPPPLPPHNPDAEIIGPITDPRPIIDGNFQVPRGHRLAGVYRNDKPRLPPDYVRYLKQQGLTPEQIEHGAGKENSRLVRAPPSKKAPAPTPAPAPSRSRPLAPVPSQVSLPGGFTLHLVPERPPPPADLYPEMQTVPSPSIGHLRKAPAGRPSARQNEVGVTTPAWPVDGGFLKHPDIAELRRHHQRVKQRLDQQWRRHLDKLDRRGGTRRGELERGGDSGAPVVRESYSVRQLPGGGRSLSYRKSTSQTTSYTTRGKPHSSRVQRLQRRKRQPVHRSTRFYAPRWHWGSARTAGRW